ncbi:HIT family protein [Actinomadura alba]|uniref:HIT family protein n=1 Tax=Actinomadura alba TaxID=406431 RepID=A0ABR7LUJ8_9ACTN|nr:HIT family protein [Actinomadura alba]MBC6468511.1 HIT family protein [Actinomadura alba]
MTDGCPFCEIGAGNADQDLIVLRTERVFVVPSLKQRLSSPGQVIVCPIEHVTALHAVDASVLAEVFGVVTRLTSAAPMAFGALGTTVLNNNDAPDQVLRHLHVHVIPRWAGDGFVIPNPDDTPAPRELRARLAAQLQRALT